MYERLFFFCFIKSQLMLYVHRIYFSNERLIVVGMNLLTQVAKIKPSHCVQYQSVVLACLSNPDATIKRQVLYMFLELSVSIMAYDVF